QIATKGDQLSVGIRLLARIAHWPSCCALRSGWRPSCDLRRKSTVFDARDRVRSPCRRPGCGDRWTGAPPQAVVRHPTMEVTKMPTIRLTNNTLALVRARSVPGYQFVDYSTERDDGTWD